MSPDDLREAAVWAAPDDDELAEAVTAWLAVRLKHHKGAQAEGSFLRHAAADAQRHIERGWDVAAFAQDTRLYALPGGLTWQQVRDAWQRLRGRAPGANPRTGALYRRRDGWPSRPELAAELLTSVSTLQRAMVEAGQGTRWPPEGLTR